MKKSKANKTNPVAKNLKNNKPKVFKMKTRYERKKMKHDRASDFGC